MSATHHPHTVEDAVGPDTPLSEAIAALLLGVVSLLMAGVLPALYGALREEGRLAASMFGPAAACEGLIMGVVTGAAGILLPPRHLKWIAAAASIALAGLNLASLGGHGIAIVVERALAGVPEGILLWITIGMIARTRTPERWAGIFFTVLTAGQMIYAFGFGEWVLPAFHADGGFIALALGGVLGIAIAFFVSPSFAPLAGDEPNGLPPPRGLFAIFATLIYIAATATTGIYLEPLATQAGLAPSVADTAVWISLAAQIAGGLAATAMAGRVRYFAVFLLSSAIFVATWGVFLLHPGASGFIAANAAQGFVSILVSAFLVPMLIEADPSRKAAVMGGATQVLAGALGPLATALIVSDNDVHGAILLGAGSLVFGLALIASLHFTATRNNHAD
ncbi:MAG TPA: hypothetical protein VG387_18655 [Rhizomicrobium sp.]|nr:hypothetical protein [Rhizomicrobium sp.]